MAGENYNKAFYLMIGALFLFSSQQRIVTQEKNFLTYCYKQGQTCDALTPSNHDDPYSQIFFLKSQDQFCYAQSSMNIYAVNIGQNFSLQYQYKYETIYKYWYDQQLGLFVYFTSQNITTIDTAQSATYLGEKSYTGDYTQGYMILSSAQELINIDGTSTGQIKKYNLNTGTLVNQGEIVPNVTQIIKLSQKYFLLKNETTRAIYSMDTLTYVKSLEPNEPVFLVLKNYFLTYTQHYYSLDTLEKLEYPIINDLVTVIDDQKHVLVRTNTQPSTIELYSANLSKGKLQSKIMTLQSDDCHTSIYNPEFVILNQKYLIYSLGYRNCIFKVDLNKHQGESSGSFPVWAIILIVILGACLIVGVVFIIYCCRKRMKNRDARNQDASKDLVNNNEEDEQEFENVHKH